ncbi:uncharacterized protein LAJ45_02271 [Morchella importuna]|uniref:uncharacterized protein n=1 Tax=Morchella importuna TaxID=1174673 RepID=UPI001E8E62C7|nr:uncharacterized protein LAJ45_02271 [Morchella importuna]KAH8153458.1 hypothetical protein LAJ45_02271 [Morchella importuna]
MMDLAVSGPDQALPTPRMDSSICLIEASYSGNFVMQQKHKTQSIANTKGKWRNLEKVRFYVQSPLQICGCPTNFIELLDNSLLGLELVHNTEQWDCYDGRIDAEGSASLILDVTGVSRAVQNKVSQKEIWNTPNS